MQTFLNLAAGSLLLIALLAYYFTVFKPIQNEKALKQEEEKRQINAFYNGLSPKSLHLVAMILKR